ncbi:MAG TPA: 16S rRNA (uracil(1498)-N(3))-methyltransferase, partial [Cryomorphaceae bacterium]|nr:16S rRNA (uracil(1498)-N(3))-methyltransferase [Cryomorphaceae bacterium]
NEFQLDTVEIHHCVKVLRKSIGDKIDFITGNGNLYQGKISFVSKSMVCGTFSKVKSNFGTVPYSLTIAIAPTKNINRIELFVEKAVEMGIEAIVPIICDRSERRVIKEDRLRKIVFSATKQSLKGKITQVQPAMTFKDFIAKEHSNLLIAHCEEGHKLSLKEMLKPNTATTILIGPEGDFSSAEIQLALKSGARPIHLG